MRKFALLVGVEEYRDPMITPLRFARADAQGLAGRLRERCGFDHVRQLTGHGEDEPLLGNIMSALTDMAAELRNDDLFLFFFAGHGVEKGEQGYLLAKDCIKAYPELNSLPLKLLREHLERLNAGKRILLLDACRNTPDAGRGEGSNTMGDVISRDILAVARTIPMGSAATALLSACSSGQRAYEWPAKGHGVFTHYLLEGLDGEAWDGDELKFCNLAEYVTEQVRQWSTGMPGLPTPQEPWYELHGSPGAIFLTRKRLFPVPPPKRAVWYLDIDGSQRGPLQSKILEREIKAGLIPTQAECWREGMGQWMRIDQTPEWSVFFPEAPPTVPPARTKIPGFLAPVQNAGYALLEALQDGSSDAQKQQKKCVKKGYPLEVAMARTGIVFRLVPPGQFLMEVGPAAGSSGSASVRQRKVIIPVPIYVGKYPVTQAQWRSVMGKESRSFFDAERLRCDAGDYPVESVSWEDCKAFIDRLNTVEGQASDNASIRLLTEAQWEYACRAGTTSTLYGDLDVIAWHGGNSGDRPHPVGQKRPNAWGLHDMIGNVSEWCVDVWRKRPKLVTHSEDSRQHRSGHVLRGASWYHRPEHCRASKRFFLATDSRNNMVGFRLAVVIE